MVLGQVPVEVNFLCSVLIFIELFVVVTGASDGIGRGYALEVIAKELDVSPLLVFIRNIPSTTL
jgi:hypothetical protein